MFLSIFSSYTLIPDISACYLRLGVGVAIYSARVKPLSLSETTRPSQNGRILLLSLRTLCTVLRAALRTVGYTSRIERTTDDVIANTREILHTTATNQHDTVLLKVVTLSGDVGVDLLLIGQTHTGNLTHCRVRLLRGRRIDTNTNTTTLRTVVQRGRLALVHDYLSAFSY